MLDNDRGRKSVCSTDNGEYLGHSAVPSTIASATTSITLETLLVGGQRKTWRFDPQTSIAAVRQHVWENWPTEWPQPRPQSDTSLRVLHLGHILDSPSITLASRGMRTGSVTVVHLVIRSTQPSEPTKPQQDPPLKKSTSREPESTPGCSCVIC